VTNTISSSVRQRINLTLLAINNRTLRQSRIERFLKRVCPSNGMTILDLGGWDGRLLHQILKTARVNKGRFIVADVDPYVEMASKVYGFEAVMLHEGGSPYHLSMGRLKPCGATR
jgi:hypothetical protein